LLSFVNFGLRRYTDSVGAADLLIHQSPEINRLGWVVEVDYCIRCVVYQQVWLCQLIREELKCKLLQPTRGRIGS
jgi:hypothetical protein